MKAFHPTFGTRPWPDGLRALQVYALPDLPEGSALRGLLAGLRKVLAGLPLVPVPDERAHITLDMITSASADAIGHAVRDSLAERLRTAVADIGPVLLQAGSPIAYRTGVRLDLHPDDRLAVLQRRVRTAVHEVFGADAAGYPLGVLHTTVAYAAADTDTDQVAQIIHYVRPGHATFTVSRIALIEVYWQRVPTPGADLPGWQICWDTHAVVPLDS
ncbi:2'-5' RNA ligase family protein [Kitasatospora sp. cg17-2]